MKFTEFVNRNKNVVQDCAAKRITASISVSEERDAFYNGELFKKYDMVEADGIPYRILEQCSNYYQVVDEAGNVSRKFAKQLTKTESVFVGIPGFFHGYQVTSEAGKKLLESIDFNNETCDDVGTLKQLKEADKMDSQFKSKDKMTVAKIIADAIVVPHDAISDPTNLVNAAIRKAKKDPALMKNKAILQNMLAIAKEVGIKYSDTSFDVNEAFVAPALSAANSNAEHARQGSGYKGSIKVPVSKVGGKRDYKEIKAHLKAKGIDKHIHSVGTGDGYQNVHIHSNTHSDAELHQLIKESIDEATKWEVSFDHGPHQSSTVQVSAKTQEEAHAKAIKAAQKLGHRSPMINHSTKVNEAEEIEESDVIRKGADGRTMIGAAALLGKARELAMKDHDPAKHGRKVLVTPEHKAAARKQLMGESHAKTATPDCGEILKYLTKAHRSLTNDVDNGLSADGKHTLTQMYNSWRHDLMNDDFAAFEKSYERWGAHHTDAFDFLVDQMFEEAKLGHHGTYEQFLKVCESVEVNELNADTLKTYSALAKQHAVKLVAGASKAKKPETAHAKLDKAGKRLDGATKADKKVFSKDWKERTGQNESVLSFAELKKTFPEGNLGHSLNGDRSEHHRHQIARKLKDV